MFNFNPVSEAMSIFAIVFGASYCDHCFDDYMDVSSQESDVTANNSNHFSSSQRFSNANVTSEIRGVGYLYRDIDLKKLSVDGRIRHPRGRRSYLIFHLDSNKQHFFSSERMNEDCFYYCS